MSKMRFPRPGHMFGLGEDGQVYEMPMPGASGTAYQQGNTLGQHPMHHGLNVDDDPYWAQFTKIPQFYVISVPIDEDTGAVGTGSVPLRPEPFVCHRITWACTGDVPPRYTGPDTAGSPQGRSCQVQWDDEFTRFLGNRPALISSLFGDSNGFLDIPRGVLLQGKQTLSVTVNRLFYPSDDSEDEGPVQFDFVFHGVGLLPKGVNQSGSAG